MDQMYAYDKKSIISSYEEGLYFLRYYYLFYGLMFYSMLRPMFIDAGHAFKA